MKAEYKVAGATAAFLLSLGACSILSLGGDGESVPSQVLKLGPLVKASASTSAEIVIPVRGVSRSSLRDTWGAPRDSGRSHKGIDIMADSGTPVLAAAAGKIIKLFESKKGGTTIYQADERGRFIFYYAHLDRYADGLKVGQNVLQGQVIAFVGETGNAPVPHLHFEIQQPSDGGKWWRGIAFNPYPVLKAGRVDGVRSPAFARMK